MIQQKIDIVKISAWRMMLQDKNVLIRCIIRIWKHNSQEMSINMHNERQVVGYVNTVGRGKVPEMLSSNNCHALRNTSSTNHPFPFTLCMKRNVFCFMAKFIESTNSVTSRYCNVLNILYILIMFIWVILNFFESDWYTWDTLRYK